LALACPWKVPAARQAKGKNKVHKSGKPPKISQDEDKIKDKGTGLEGGFDGFDRLLQGHFLHGLKTKRLSNTNDKKDKDKDKKTRRRQDKTLGLMYMKLE
jgi:hypothetical protein